ncbi:MAG: sugar phosphate nucleotidyltransferase, partial [Pseudomonadota bacterium]
RVTGFEEKPENPTPMYGKTDTCLASMGNYVFNTHFLYEQVIKDADNPKTQHDFGKNIIPSIIDRYAVHAYPLQDPDSGKQAYWRDVGTLDGYFEANMELVSVSPEFNIYDREWPIFTHQMQAPPAKFVFNDDNRRGMAVDSMVSGGCVISGAQLHGSLLFSNSHVHSYSTVRDSVILPEVEIGENCHIHRAIIDRGANIPAGTRIGYDAEEDRSRGFRVTDSGVVLVTPDMLGQQLHFIR